MDLFGNNLLIYLPVQGLGIFKVKQLIINMKYLIIVMSSVLSLVWTLYNWVVVVRRYEFRDSGSQHLNK